MSIPPSLFRTTIPDMSIVVPIHASFLAMVKLKLASLYPLALIGH